MSFNINSQKPATKNQISNEKPSIIKNSNVLQGYFANSINGGWLKPIAYAPIMAGTRMMEYRLRANIKMLTPKTVSFQALKATFKLFFVPNSRVWKDSEKFESQKGGSSETKIKKIPNMGSFNVKFLQVGENPLDLTSINALDTTMFRDSWASTYIPRYQTGATSSTLSLAFPEYSVLPMRGFVAIYNDYLRNKEYDEKLEEFNGNSGLNESRYYITSGDPIADYFGNHKRFLRGRRQNSYYTDYRTELLGGDGTMPDLTGSNAIVDLVEFEKKIAELRSESENSQLNDWDVIAKIRGSKPLTEGKVQLLATRTINLNYQPVTQDTYNINPNVTEEFQAMGQQGAYSYTEVDLPMTQMMEFKESGYLHVVMQVTADTIFETGFERTGLNINAEDQYRPDLKELKNDVIYNIEKCGTRYTNASQLKEITGYKRKFNEYFKLPNSIAGDLTTRGYYEPNDYSGTSYAYNGEFVEDLTYINSHKSFQFFEQDDKETGDYKKKNIWQDYTDVLINDNQAVKNEVISLENENESQIIVKGQNQIFFVGMQTLIADLPIDESIKNNYTKYGEK